jgi:hypothetical protein
MTASVPGLGKGSLQWGAIPSAYKEAPQSLLPRMPPYLFFLWVLWRSRTVLGPVDHNAPFSMGGPPPLSALLYCIPRHTTPLPGIIFGHNVKHAPGFGKFRAEEEGSHRWHLLLSCVTTLNTREDKRKSIILAQLQYFLFSLQPICKFNIIILILWR